VTEPFFRKTTLPNGTRIVTSHLEQVRSATILLSYHVGSRDEGAENSGTAHFIEHMLFKGTERRPHSRDISEEIEGTGGSIDAGTGRETTTYSVRVPRDAVRVGFDVLSDMILHSRFRLEDVEREREVITEEIRGINDIPDEVVSELSDALVWPESPVGRPIAGTEETVGSFTRDGLRRYLDAYYTPERLVISAAGTVQHDELVALAVETFGQLPGGRNVPTPFVTPVPQTAPRVAVVGKEIEQANLALAVQAVPYLDERKYAQYLLHIILGGTMSSRLFLRIREDLGLAYSVGTYLQTLPDAGWATIYAAVEADRAQETTAAILHELERLRREPISPVEFERARRYVTGSLLMGLEGSGAVASWIGARELLMGDVLTPEEVVAEYNRVTLDDVHDLARELFLPERLSLAVVGPYEDDGPFRALLGA